MLPDMPRLALHRPDREVVQLPEGHGAAHLLGHWELRPVLSGPREPLLCLTDGWHDYGTGVPSGFWASSASSLSAAAVNASCTFCTSASDIPVPIWPLMSVMSCAMFVVAVSILARMASRSSTLAMRCAP